MVPCSHSLTHSQHAAQRSAAHCAAAATVACQCGSVATKRSRCARRGRACVFGCSCWLVWLCGWRLVLDVASYAQRKESSGAGGSATYSALPLRLYAREHTRVHEYSATWDVRPRAGECGQPAHQAGLRRRPLVGGTASKTGTSCRWAVGHHGGRMAQGPAPSDVCVRACDSEAA
jgi:hypothetical protein